jgi:hypothetical protein
MYYLSAFWSAVRGRLAAAMAIGRNRCGRLVYSIQWDREKPPFADRAPRPVGQCDAIPQDGQPFGCRAASQRRAIGS